jgi:hypothetical protein
MSRLPICAAAPVPRRVDDRLMPAQQVANPVKIAVGVADKLLDQCRIEARFVLHFAELRGFNTSVPF